jgi:hypothetical protein
VDLRGLLPVASTVLTGLATQIVVSAPGWTLRRLRGSAEGSALVRAVAESVCLAFYDARADPAEDAEWIEEVAKQWQPAFTPAVCTRLLATLSADADGSAFRSAALDALHDAGTDATELGQVLDVEEFLYILPRRLFAGLREASLAPDSKLRDIVVALGLTALTALNQATPREFAADLTELLGADGVTGGPRYAAVRAPWIGRHSHDRHDPGTEGSPPGYQLEGPRRP